MKKSPVRHFTILKGNFGWEIFNGEPDSIGDRTTYNSFLHSNDVFDYCDMFAKTQGKVASIHFDTRSQAGREGAK